jgi:GntR family histidine utilization transcriptional repressor
MAESPYQRIKRSIAEGIASGRWLAGQVLPSEHALTRQFKVSRMTVNRAMRELANQNLIRRVPGVGSFVAEPVAQSALVEIRNIADEIVSRGHVHRAEVLFLGSINAAPALAEEFGLEEGGKLFHSRILHLENGVPLQLEERLVHPALAPGYLQQDFTKTTPNAFLTQVAPLHSFEHHVRAVSADDERAQLLGLAPGDACLLVHRRTFSNRRMVSMAELYHPGLRFALAGKFTP